MRPKLLHFSEKFQHAAGRCTYQNTRARNHRVVKIITCVLVCCVDATKLDGERPDPGMKFGMGSVLCHYVHMMFVLRVHKQCIGVKASSCKASPSFVADSVHQAQGPDKINSVALDIGKRYCTEG